VDCGRDASKEGIEVWVVDFCLQVREFGVGGRLDGLREFPRALFLNGWGRESKLLDVPVHITVAGLVDWVSLGKSGVRCHVGILAQ
jgi:hypothetical protein